MGDRRLVLRLILGKKGSSDMVLVVVNSFYYIALLALYNRLEIWVEKINH